MLRAQKLTANHVKTERGAIHSPHRVAVVSLMYVMPLLVILLGIVLR